VIAYQRSLEIRGDDPATLNNLALSLQHIGDYTTAEPLYRKALAVDQKALGPDHLYVATSLKNLAELLKHKGDYAGAEQLYRRALAIDEKMLGPDHLDVASDLDNVAGLLKHKGDFAGAEPLYRRALAIYEKALGPDSPWTRATSRNLDELQKSAKRGG
jgi:tetratricopeptide (TPR) repeat protein